MVAGLEACPVRRLRALGVSSLEKRLIGDLTAPCSTVGRGSRVRCRALLLPGNCWQKVNGLLSYSSRCFCSELVLLHEPTYFRVFEKLGLKYKVCMEKE